MNEPALLSTRCRGRNPLPPDCLDRAQWQRWRPASWPTSGGWFPHRCWRRANRLAPARPEVSSCPGCKGTHTIHVRGRTAHCSGNRSLDHLVPQQPPIRLSVARFGFKAAAQQPIYQPSLDHSSVVLSKLAVPVVFLVQLDEGPSVEATPIIGQRETPPALGSAANGASRVFHQIR